METVIGYLLLALLIGGFIGSAFTAGRHPKLADGGGTRALPPSAPAPEPPRELPLVPSMPERMRAVGIPTAALYEGMGSYGIEVPAVQTERGSTWCPFADRGMRWLGSMFVVSAVHLREGERQVPPSACCDRCDGAMGMVFYEIVKERVPPGQLDRGWTEPRPLGRWCTRCGDFQEGRTADSNVLGALWTAHRNMYELVEALESDDAKRALKEAKLTRVETELQDVEGRRNRLMHERNRLQDELGTLKGHPGRDRFPTASLDDPPDDRAKAMPAIVARNGPYGNADDD